MTDKFVERMGVKAVAHDVRIMGDFVQIWCDGHHRGRVRHPVGTDGAELGVYRRRMQLCGECQEHLAYAEKRRAFCPKDPKPFCINCDSHCYKTSEREWQRSMMRFSGPRSWSKGHAIDGIKHVMEVRKFKRAAKAAAQGKPGA